MKKFVAMIIALFMMFTLVNAACAEAAADRDWLDGNTITIVVFQTIHISCNSL